MNQALKEALKAEIRQRVQEQRRAGERRTVGKQDAKMQHQNVGLAAMQLDTAVAKILDARGVCLALARGLRANALGDFPRADPGQFDAAKEDFASAIDLINQAKEHVKNGTSAMSRGIFSMGG